MKRRGLIYFCVIGMMGLLLGGCAKQEQSEGEGGLSIVTTLFPQYDFAKEIVGDVGQVTLLLTPGMESHSYEPTPADIIAINKADLFIYTGADMEPWVEQVLDSLDKDVMVIDLSEYVTLDREEESDEDEHDTEEHSHTHTYDPHIWTSPENAILMVTAIRDAINLLDEENVKIYSRNCTNYVMELNELDKSFRELSEEDNVHNTLVFGGRFAFHYLFRDFGWDYISAYDGCSTETEPSTKKIAQIIDYINENDINVVYYEELTEPTVAKSISEATGAQMLLLHSCHNVTQEELDEGVSYITLMQQNLENIRKGLSE